jgi:hypothetical protein
MNSMNTVHVVPLWRRVISGTVWGVLLVLPLFLLLAYGCYSVHSQLLSKGFHETLAPVFLSIAGAIFVHRWWRESRPVSLLLAVLTGVLLCGDLHLLGTKGLYAALIVVAAWGVVWWRHIAADIRDSGSTSVLTFAALAYVLSQAVSALPLQHLMASGTEAIQFGLGLEEALENLGHVAILLVAVLGFMRWDEDEDDELAAMADMPSSTLGAS